MNYTKHRVVVFGNDHTNTIGVIQSLGGRDFEIIALLFGDITGIVKSSKYVEKMISACDADACVGLLLERNTMFKSCTVIIPCCDSAQLALDKRKNELWCNGFLFSYSTKKLDLKEYFNKDVQVRLASNSGLNVPNSRSVNDIKDLMCSISFPCLIKPLVSCLGGKDQIRICRNQKELIQQYNSISNRTDIILQQYINRDYEISFLGCGMKDGTCYIPAVEDKLTLYPKNVGLECLAKIHSFDDEKLIESVKKIITDIGYIGLFSVEMMHSKDDNKFYFTEINLRNDGAQSFIFKYGINLPLIHVCDLLDIDKKDAFGELSPGYYIWDVHHTKSLLSGDISLMQWIREIGMSKGFLMYNRKDKKPFFRNYYYLLKKAIDNKKVIRY